MASGRRVGEGAAPAGVVVVVVVEETEARWAEGVLEGGARGLRRAVMAWTLVGCEMRGSLMMMGRGVTYP